MRRRPKSLSISDSQEGSPPTPLPSRASSLRQSTGQAVVLIPLSGERSALAESSSSMGA